MKESKCMQLLLEATIYQMLPNMQPLLQTSRTQIRSNSNHLIVLGGVLRQQLSVSNQLRAFDENKKVKPILQFFFIHEKYSGLAAIARNGSPAISTWNRSHWKLLIRCRRPKQLRYERQDRRRHCFPLRSENEFVARSRQSQ